MNSIIFRIDIDIYGTYIVVSFGMNRKLVQVNLERKYSVKAKVGKMYAGLCQAIELDEHAAMVLIAFSTPFNMTANGIIAHEALHATNRILEHVGVEPDHINDEAQAYLLSYIVDQIHEQGEKL